jgi:glycosyltransferase involved in cell wall biosynthesis
MTPRLQKIGIVTGEYPPMQGGVGDFSRELAAALAAQGHEVHVITRTAAQAESQPFQVHPAIDHWGWECLAQVIDLARYLGLDALDIQYQAAAYDLRPAIHFLTWRIRPGLAWLRPRGLSHLALAVTFHDLKVPYLFPKAGRLRDWVVTNLARRADVAIVTNRADELELNRRQVEPVVRIPIGSNIGPSLPVDYDRDAWRERLGLRPDDFLLGYFGFLNEKKGGETLVRALARLEDKVHLLFIGGLIGSSDPTNRAYLERVERLIVQFGLQERVHRTGYVPAQEVSAAFAAVDLCVLPYSEGVSFHHGTLMAALAHGCPIVSTTPRVGLPELRPGYNISLIQPENPVALAEAITSLIAAPAALARLAQGAVELSARFTWDHIAARTAELFESLRG